MRVARWQNNVTTLGPGNRVALWVQGCSRNCKGCIAQELRLHDDCPDMDVDILIAIVNALLTQSGASGFTISGGEPMDQADELVRLLSGVQAEDILLYTGWPFEDVLRHPAWPHISSRIAAIIPEPYIAEQNRGNGLRGSENQPIIVLDPRFLRRYSAAAMQSRSVQLQQVSDGIVFVGIPPKGFAALVSEGRNHP